MKTVHQENVKNNIEAEWKRKLASNAVFLDCDKFLAHLITNQIAKSDLSKVKNYLFED